MDPNADFIKHFRTQRIAIIFKSKDEYELLHKVFATKYDRSMNIGVISFFHLTRPNWFISSGPQINPYWAKGYIRMTCKEFFKVLSGSIYYELI